MSRRYRNLLAVVLVAALAMLAAPVQASTHPDNTAFTWDRALQASGQTKVATGLCIEWHVNGTLRFTVEHWHNPDAVQWKNPRLVSPTVTIYAYDRCVGHYYDYRKNKTFYDARIGGRIWGSNKDEACHYNPSLSAGFPWGVSVSVTPTCGSTKTGYHFTARVQPPHAIHSASYHVKGIAAEWKITDKTQVNWDNGRTHYVCFNANANFTIWRSSATSASGVSAKGQPNGPCINMYAALNA